MPPDVHTIPCESVKERIENQRVDLIAAEVSLPVLLAATVGLTVLIVCCCCNGGGNRRN